MSHPLTPNRQVVFDNSFVKSCALPIQPILPLTSCELAGLTDLRGEVQNQREIRLDALRGRLVRCTDQYRVQTTAHHLVSFGGKRVPVGENDSPSGKRRADYRIDQVGPGCQVKEELRDGPDGMLRIQDCLPRDFPRAGASRLPDQDRVDLGLTHPSRKGAKQCRFPGALGSFQDNKKAAPLHPRVMMLLAAPLSIPSLIC